MKQKKGFIVYRMAMANDLLQQGFRILSIAADKNKTMHTVYFFEDTPELKAAAQKLAEKYRNYKN